MTGSEFEEKLIQKEVKYVIANMLAEQSPMHIKLSHSSEANINRYIQKADEVLESFSKYGLRIVVS